MLLILAMSVLLIFVDGLGIGTRGAHNPLDLLGEEASPLAVFRDEEPRLPFGGVLVRTDATLGVEGRPKSASGQTTILTGVNAPAPLANARRGRGSPRARRGRALLHALRALPHRPHGPRAEHRGRARSAPQPRALRPRGSRQR